MTSLARTRIPGDHGFTADELQRTVEVTHPLGGVVRDTVANLLAGGYVTQDEVRVLFDEEARK